MSERTVALMVAEVRGFTGRLWFSVCRTRALTMSDHTSDHTPNHTLRGLWPRSDAGEPAGKDRRSPEIVVVAQLLGNTW